MGRDIYCDDLLTSLRTEEEAADFVVAAKRIFEEAGMNLTKWKSNARLREKPTVDDRDDEDEYLIGSKLGGQTDPTKVLGVQWLPSEDVLMFTGSALKELGMGLRGTKRNILRISARVFDPCGLISPFTLRAKKLLKDLWMMGVGWDDELPEPVRDSWLEWLEDLENLAAVSTRRAFASINVEKLSIHTFCDASKDAYAAAVYLRTCGPGPIETRLVMSKSRLAPSKPMSLPRLELMGAVLGARLTAFVIDGLQRECEEVTLWTDSTVALAWIKSDPKRWGTFVANRVTEIQTQFPPELWRHCPGNCNPADLPSRGAQALKVGSELWQTGPSWLREAEEK